MSLALRETLLAGRKRRYLFRDDFSGAAIDTTRWSVTDTESKLSESGGSLVCSGGKATPAYDDPRLTSARSFVPVAGCTFECEFKATTLAEFQVGFDSTTPIANAVRPSFLVYEFLDIRPVSGSITLPVALSTATSYRLRLVIQGLSGTLFYLSVDGGLSWKLVWADQLTLPALLYCGYDNKSAAFTSSFVRVYRGRVRPAIVSATPAVVPSLGAEVIVNGAFAADTDWTKDAGWTIAAGVASVNVAGGGYFIYQTPLTVGVWYLAAMDINAVTGSGLSLTTDTTEAGLVFSTTGAKTTTSRALATRAAVKTRGVVAVTGEVDNVSFKPLTLSSLLSANQPAAAEGIWDAAVTVASGYQGGMWLNWDGNSDGTQDCVEAIVDRSQGTARLSKYVAGTLTNNIISAAITYSAGATLRVVRVGNSVALYYNGTQVGTTQTISDAGITSQTGFTAFATDPAATVALTMQTGT